DRSVAMSPPDALEQIAARYREEGYQVSIRPSAADLPSFLENSEVLLYAHKGSEHLALGRRSLVAGAATLDASAVFAAKDSDVTYLRTLLSEAEGFLRMGAVDAALLLGWAVTEAALREAARSNGADLQRETPRKLMEAAGASKTLSSEEQVTLEL